LYLLLYAVPGGVGSVTAGFGVAAGGSLFLFKNIPCFFVSKNYKKEFSFVNSYKPKVNEEGKGKGCAQAPWLSLWSRC